MRGRVVACVSNNDEIIQTTVESDSRATDGDSSAREKSTRSASHVTRRVGLVASSSRG